jgi:hypothetical protein
MKFSGSEVEVKPPSYMYRLYFNGILYKTYDKIGHVKAAIRAKRYYLAKDVQIEKLRCTVAEIENAETFMPEQCPECKEYKSKSKNTRDHSYFCSRKNEEG